MKWNHALIIALTAGPLLGSGLAADAAQHRAQPQSSIPADLAKQAKIGLDEARATALAQVPGGKVKSEELERERGKLIYSFDITVPGRSGVEEVNVNAVDGKVVGKKHESARSEAREKRREPAEHGKPSGR
jgi:hypothetical protein